MRVRHRRDNNPPRPAGQRPSRPGRISPLFSDGAGIGGADEGGSAPNGGDFKGTAVSARRGRAPVAPAGCTCGGRGGGVTPRGAGAASVVVDGKLSEVRLELCRLSPSRGREEKNSAIPRRTDIEDRQRARRRLGRAPPGQVGIDRSPNAQTPGLTIGYDRIRRARMRVSPATTAPPARATQPPAPSRVAPS